MTVRVWDGKVWERYCLKLLRLHYGADQLQEIPDRHGGDLGLEAFTLDGCAYQCYAALEPVSTPDLYENQRDKLTEDLATLRRKKLEVARLLGSVVIQRYMFMVHRHDSHRLVQHASTKAAEVRGWGLLFIGEDFKIVIVTDEAFAKERASIVDVDRASMDIATETVDGLDAWRSENTTLVATANRKLALLPISVNSRQKYIEQLLQQYLDGENALSRVRDRYPDQWQAAVNCKSRKEGRLVLEYGELLENPSAVQLTKIARELADELQAAVPPMDGELARCLSWASLADWLMRCPLELAEDGALK